MNLTFVFSLALKFMSVSGFDDWKIELPDIHVGDGVYNKKRIGL